VSLETNLASNSYKYSSEDRVVSGDEDSYIIVDFSAEVHVPSVTIVISVDVSMCLVYQ